MKVYSGTCIVTRGSHSEMRFIIGAYANRDAALAGLMVPITTDEDSDQSFPRAQISSVRVQEIPLDMLKRWVSGIELAETPKAEKEAA